MTNAILQTKLFIPPVRTDLVPRPRLLKVLTAGLSGKMTLVSAPAGFGKTTLISSWLVEMSSDYQIAWLSLEESDSDPSQFLAYFIGALQKIHPDIGQDVVNASPLPPLEMIMVSVINEISAADQPFILVLDDYHLITGSDIHRGMAYLLAHMPPQMHLVFISRSDPPFSLSKWRARHQLTEIRARDLRFTHTETSVFLNEAMALVLDGDEVALLETRTEGWIAGLQLAAHSLQIEQDRTAFLEAFAGDDRYVADYLVEEVLASQPESLQSFLLHTSILTRLCASLCDFLLDRKDSQAVLEFLEKSNLFVVSLDSRRQWYRYHHLFADLLRDRLTLSPEGIHSLQLRASRWHADHGLLPEAVEHALQAEDYPEAMRLILMSAGEMFMTNRLSMLLQWWQEVPPDLALTHPQLCMMAAWAWLALSQHQQSEACLQAVERSLATPMNALLTDMDAMDPGIRNGLIEVATVRITFQSVAPGDAQNTLALCRHILPYLVQGDEHYLFNPPSSLRPVVLFNMGLAYERLNQLDAAIDGFRESIRLGTSLGNAHIVAPALGHLAEVEIAQGRLHQAMETCKQGIASLTAITGRTSPLTGLLHVRLGDLYTEWNDLSEAVHQYGEGVELAKRWQHRETLLPGYLGLARAYRLQSQDRLAQEAQQALDSLIRSEPVSPESNIAADFAKLHMQQGNVESVQRWVERIKHMAICSLPTTTAITLAKVYLHQGREQEAIDIASEILDTAESEGRWGAVVETLVILAAGNDVLGLRENATRALLQAMAQGQRGGYVRTFVDAGQRVAELLRGLAQTDQLSAYGTKLLAACQGVSQADDATPRATLAAGALVEPLSERELEVLHLIAEGYTNKEIAAQLYLSAGTVKVHAHNIYGKLGVSGRTKAVAIARELGLLL